jgi:hypothetical protein
MIDLPTTQDRVSRNTADQVQADLTKQLRGNFAYYAAAGPEEIDRRLAELDREWDIERVLELNAGLLGTALVTWGLVSRRQRPWLLMAGVVTSFLTQHALQGWCPPLPIFRRLGFRTAAEIHRERDGLRLLRGDYQDVNLQTGDMESTVNSLMAITHGSMTAR